MDAWIVVQFTVKPSGSVEVKSASFWTAWEDRERSFITFVTEVCMFAFDRITWSLEPAHVTSSLTPPETSEPAPRMNSAPPSSVPKDFVVAEPQKRTAWGAKPRPVMACGPTVVGRVWASDRYEPPSRTSVQNWAPPDVARSTFRLKPSSSKE